MRLPPLLTLLAVTLTNLIINPILAAENIHTFHPQVIVIMLSIISMGKVG